MAELVKDVKAIEDEEEEFIDESLAERLWGLTEMFPESVRNACSMATDLSWATTKASLKFGRSAIWVLASSVTILVLPVLCEKERAAMQEQQLQQQRQILLGANTAVSGQSGMNMPPLPNLTAAPPTV
ncbi:Mitochondrial import receptor subunit TOM22 [Mactra antiquata]